MILKTCLVLVVSVALEVSGASYSQVFMQAGREAGLPAEYVSYASPYEYAAGSYNAAPIASQFPSFSYRSYPEQTLAAIAPVAPSSNVVYGGQISNLPYTIELNEPHHTQSTAYRYVILEDGAGPELKLSNSELIHGGYTFLQPEGLVQYVAEDNQGLNAIFKNYIPNEAIAHTETVHHQTVHHDSVHHAEPCREAKSEALTESLDEVQEERHGSHHESEEHETEHVAHHDAHAHHEDHETHHEGHETHHKGHETHHEDHEAHQDHEARHGGHEDTEVHEIILHGAGSDHDHHIHEDHIIVITKSGEESHHESEPEEHHHVDHEKPTHDTESHHTHEAIVEAPHEHHETHNINHEGHVATPVPAQVGNNVYISYNDFIKCIQAAIARGNTHPYYAPLPKPTSPLTYLIFNKPC